MRLLGRKFRFWAFAESYGEVARLTNEDSMDLEPVLYECDRNDCDGRRWLARSGSRCTGVEGQRHSPYTMEAIRDDGNGDTPRAILSHEDEGWRNG
jgi:hypothetical protein